MFKVVDLFAGPGGLAEGFSSVLNSDDSRVFDIALSVEKEASAFRTLQLRSFVRQFDGQLPDEYYRYLANEITRAELLDRFPEEWARVKEETQQLELGTPEAARRIDPILDAIRAENVDTTVLVGGPPCQAYSLVGRARNKGNSGYVAREDHRHFLYREYIRILARLRPAAFVMENVKGLLSATVDGERIFNRVVDDLQGAGDGYDIVPLVAGPSRDGREFLLEAERHGVPQRRHRVILFGVRSDIASRLVGSPIDGPGLDILPEVPVETVLADMPRLRSGISRGVDDPGKWRRAVTDAYLHAAQASGQAGASGLGTVEIRLRELASAVMSGPDLSRCSGRPAAVRSNELGDWLIDPKLYTLPNHESRSHMQTDLARYAFAATFAEVTKRSPTARDFPEGLAPSHRSWKTGKFNDRFKVQIWEEPSSTITCHIAKDGHYFIHPDPLQCRSLTVREAARIQTFPDNYKFEGNRTQQYTQVGNAVPPLLARRIAEVVRTALTHSSQGALPMARQVAA
jgi:DNA (cytosine-5)-methyltransferase 1